MGNEREIFIEIFRFLRDWDNHAATIFNRSQSAYLENMQQPRAWGCYVPVGLVQHGPEQSVDGIPIKFVG